ncbi:hypothetical protein [Winogradskyella sp.]|jgi:hypothetical protein|uniref:hypothetical protein n=1 Tax=Winogradskyella sp. TaxID=1883156 RepID=UPI0025DB8316|nr:hypothetical protein [Winogradskyella sp.]MCT4630154.1 hypothetical protein [Winogradskyella sp.]
MNEKKNIDRLFQEKFKDFEAAPSDAVWDRISESLPKKKKKRRVIALWWQIGGVAAAIALLLTVGVSIFNSDNNNSKSPVIVDTEKTNNNSIENDNNSNSQNVKNNLNTTNNTEVAKSSNEDNESISKETDKSILKENTSNKALTTPNASKSNSLVNNTDKNKKASSTQHKSLTKIENKDNSTKVASSINNSKNNILKNSTINDSEIKSVIKEAIKNNSSTVTDNTTSNESETSNNKGTQNNKELEKETSILKEDENKESIIDAIADNNEDIDEKEEEEDKQSRWSIAPNIAPVYYSSLGKGSSIDQQFNNNSKSSDINMSYGITGSYTISKKLKVRAGISRVNLSQSTSDVFAFNGGEFASRNAETSMRNINPKEGLGNITFMSANMFNTSTTPEVFNTKIVGNIDQRFSFIEVPLELEYRVLDKKFGVNVIGGFSTFFLNQNEIYADLDGTSTLIGEASNLNTTSFSANFGLGLDYSLSKQWNINLEPQFKYQINTFNNTSGNYRPFFIGLYTGLSYKF